MAAHMEKPRDVIGGALVAAIGTGFLLVGRELKTGTSVRMGPGYFPLVLSVLLIGLGAGIAVLALRKPAAPLADEVGPIPWRGIVLVIGATVGFALGLRGLGLAPAVALVVLATAWASQYARLHTSVPLAVGLAAFCVVLFVRGLGLPLPVVGPWLSPAYWSPPPPAAPPAPAAAPAAPVPPPAAAQQ